MNSSLLCVQLLQQKFKEGGIDKTILIIAYGLTAMMIVTFNVILIKLLSKRKGGRASRLFLLLSISDTMIGCLTIPSMIVSFMDIREICYIVYPIIQFFVFLPTTLSSMLTCIISIERCVVITKLHIRSSTRRFINFCIATSLMICILHAFWRSMNTRSKTETLSEKIRFVAQITAQCGILLISIFINLYLCRSVRTKSKKMKPSRCQLNQSNNYSTQLTKTII